MKIVLFLGICNSTRSQMAEAILRQRASGYLEAYSAGTHPDDVHPLTRHVLAEVGIDASDLTAKGLRQFLGRLTVNYAILLSDPQETNSPRVYPFALQTLLWPFDNPASIEGAQENQLSAFRRVRDEITARIDEWLHQEALLEADMLAAV